MGKRTCDCIGKIDQGSGNSAAKLKIQWACERFTNRSMTCPSSGDYNFTPAKMAEAEGAQFGRVLGMQMATQCPQNADARRRKHGGATSRPSQPGAAARCGAACRDHRVVTITLRESMAARSATPGRSQHRATRRLPGSYANLVGQSLRVRYEARELFASAHRRVPQGPGDHPGRPRERSGAAARRENA